jgi:cytochrome b561
MSMRPYRPGPAGLEPNPVELRTWRSRLRSRRWRPAPLANPEVEPTSSRIAFAFWLGLAVLTFVILVVGYGIGFWGA